jgi:serine protease Do
MKDVQQAPNQDAQTRAHESQSKTITIKINATGLMLCLLVLLLTGAGISAVIVKRVGAAPSAYETLRTSSDTATVSSLSAAFASATKLVESSVVHITTVDFDGDGESYSQSSGSGVIMDPSGYVITNYHVVKDANKIKVRLSDGSLLTGSVIGIDEDTDLAVVKVNSSKPLKAVRVGDSDAIVVGDWVIAIGSPFGLEQTVTAGIISARERVTDERRSFQQFLQTDAAINPGNSGGPLVNMSGEVIGINSQIATHKGNFEGVGFAVPSTIFTDVYNQLITQGRVSRGYLGIYPTKVTPQFAQVYNLETETGAIINDLTDNHKIKDDRDLVRRIVAAKVNIPLNVKVMRNGQLMTASVKLIEREATNKKTLPTAKPRPIPDAKPRLARDKNDRSDLKLGLDIAPLTEMRAQQMGYKTTTGVMVRTVNADNVAYDAGLRDGDVIKEINRQTISKEEDYEQIVNKLKPGDSLVMYVEKRARLGGSSSHRYISLTIP